METIKDRIIIFIQNQRLSVRRFEQMANLSNGAVSKMGNSPRSFVVENILTAYPELSRTWLLTGEGPMLAEPPGASAQPEEHGIPLLDLDASAGFSLIEATDGGNTRMLSLPHCDGAINVRGHSMEPEIHDGDIAAFVMLPSAASIRPDGIYIVQYVDDDGFTHVTIKRTKCSPRGERYVRLASVNEEYGHEDVALASITRAAKVRFTLSLLSY